MYTYNYYYYYHHNRVLLLLIVEKLKVHYVYNSWQFSHLNIISFIYFCTIVHGIIFVNLLFNTMTLNTM